MSYLNITPSAPAMKWKTQIPQTRAGRGGMDLWLSLHSRIESKSSISSNASFNAKLEAVNDYAGLPRQLKTRTIQPPPIRSHLPLARRPPGSEGYSRRC